MASLKCIWGNGLFCVWLLGCASAPKPAQENSNRPDISIPRRVAILPFGDAPGADAGRSGQVVAGVLIDSVRCNTNWQVIERAAVDTLKAEVELGAEGYLNPATAAKVGKILGAQDVIVGNVSQYEIGSIPFFFFLVLDMNIYRIGYSFRIVDVETGEIKWSASTCASSTKSLETCATVATKKIFDAWLTAPR